MEEEVEGCLEEEEEDPSVEEEVSLISSKRERESEVRVGRTRTDEVLFPFFVRPQEEEGTTVEEAAITEEVEEDLAAVDLGEGEEEEVSSTRSLSSFHAFVVFSTKRLQTDPLPFLSSIVGHHGGGGGQFSFFLSSFHAEKTESRRRADRAEPLSALLSLLRSTLEASIGSRFYLGALYYLFYYARSTGSVGFSVRLVLDTRPSSLPLVSRRETRETPPSLFLFQPPVTLSPLLKSR